MTELIPGHTFNLRPVVAYPHLFDANTKKVIPLSEAKPAKGENRIPEHEVLDTITLAVEAGIVPSESWVSFLFGTVEAFESFMEELEEYDEQFRIADRWWFALYKLANVIDEEGFISSQEIADKLRERAEETGQL